MISRRRRFLASTGAVIASLSGCLGSDEETNPTNGTDTDGSDNSSDDTDGEVDEDLSAEEVEFPDGVSESGIDDIDGVRDQYFDVLSENAFRVILDGKVDSFLRNKSANRTTITVDPREKEYVADFEDVDYETGKREPTSGRYFSLPNNEHALWDPSLREEYRYTTSVTEDYFEELFSNLENNLNTKLDLIDGFEYEFNRGEEREAPIGDVVVLDATNRKENVDLPMTGVGRAGPTYTLTSGEVAISATGVIVSYDFHLETTETEQEDDKDRYVFRESFRTEGLGEVAVSRPSWVDTAEQNA